LDNGDFDCWTNRLLAELEWQNLSLHNFEISGRGGTRDRVPL